MLAHRYPDPVTPWNLGKGRRPRGRDERSGDVVTGGDPGADELMADLAETSGAPSRENPGGTGQQTGDVPEQDHDVAAVLRVTSFRRLWLALGGSSFGDWLGLLATTEMAHQLGGTSYADANLAVAGVLILRLAPAVLLGPIAGALADRLNRKFLLVTGDILRGLLFITIPIVGSLGWLYVATVLIEILALFWMPAKDATVPNLVPRNRLEAANQMSLVTTYGTAPIAALAFSGVSLLNGILDNFLQRLYTNPVDLALYVNAATFIVSGLVIARLPIPESPHLEAARAAGESGQRDSVTRSIGEGWKFIGTTPAIRGLVIGMLGAFAAAGFVIGLASTYVNDIGAGQPGYGALFASVFLGLALGMWLGPRLLSGFSRYRLFGLSLIAAGGFLAADALIPNLVMAVLLTAGLGACGGIAWVTGYTLLGLTVDDAVRGRTFAFISSAARIVLVAVLAAGPALAAVIGRHTIHFSDTFELTYNGSAYVFLLGAILVVSLGVVAYRQMDDRPGTGLLTDLRQLWVDKRDHPAQAAARTHPGVFIALEGGDGTGKSTQARLLADWLEEDQGHDVVLTREPGATPVGVRLREVLLSNGTDVGARAEALLFAADRAHHVATVVRPALERGSIVVTDRYIDSSVAYQGAGRDLDGEEVARLSRWGTDGLVPDLTVLLDVDPLISKGRRERDAARTNGADRLESLPDDFHARVRARFQQLARRTPHRYLVIDAGLTVDEIQQLIRRRVREVLPISARRRAQLSERLAVEEQARTRRAAAEAEVLRMDADLRAKRMDEARLREESRRRAREEAELQLQEEADREVRAQAVTPPTGLTAPSAQSVPRSEPWSEASSDPASGPRSESPSASSLPTVQLPVAPLPAAMPPAAPLTSAAHPGTATAEPSVAVEDRPDDEDDER